MPRQTVHSLFSICFRTICFQRDFSRDSRTIRVFFALHFFFVGCATTAIPTLASTHNREGTQLLSSGDLDRAEARFRLALEFQPRFAEARANLGVVALSRNRFAQAEEHFRAAISCREDFPEAHAGLGAVLEHMHREQEALSSYERALSIHPGLQTARLNLAHLLIRFGRWEEARAHLLRAHENDSSDPTVAACLAQVEWELSRPIAAAAWLERAFAAERVPALAHLVRSTIHAHGGRLQEALEDAHRAAQDESYRERASLRVAALLVEAHLPQESLDYLRDNLRGDELDSAFALVVRARAQRLVVGANDESNAWCQRAMRNVDSQASGMREWVRAQCDE